MPSTDWTNERIPGGSYLYDDSAVTYDEASIIGEAGVPTYELIGSATSWTNETL